MPLLGNRYDPVADVGPIDSRKRVLQREEDFEYGINFTSKYIGTQDVAQPHNRVEIVAAMRRIRFECKTRGIKKQKVDITVSVKGIKVMLFRRNKKKYQAEGNLPILEHPIYRIFYVSHDSHDLLIFSYISREASTNHFRCNVFKAFKKSHAVQVVRTIGQAFDICHKLAVEAELDEGDNNKGNDNTTENQTACQVDVQDASAVSQKSPGPVQTSIDSGHSVTSDCIIRRAQQVLAAANYNPSSTTLAGFKAVGTIASPLAPLADDAILGDGFLSGQEQMQLLLHQQRELQSHQTHCLLSQMQLLKDQLGAETEARIEAQARIHQLLMQNQELLEHINVLVQRVIQLEAPNNARAPPDNYHLPQIPFYPDTMTTSTVCPIRTSCTSLPRSAQSHAGKVTVSVQNVSPDSGHRELSSESLSVSEVITRPAGMSSWYAAPTSQMLSMSSALDFKRSLVALSSAKSVEISKVPACHSMSRYHPCSSGELPAVLDERLNPGDVEVDSAGNRGGTSSFTAPTKSSSLSMHTECRYDYHLKNELMLCPDHCNLTSRIANPTDCSQSSTCVRNPTKFGNFDQISSKPSSGTVPEVNGLVTVTLTGNTEAPSSSNNLMNLGVNTISVIGEDSTGDTTFNTNGWNQMSSQNQCKELTLNHSAINSWPVNFSEQMLNVSG